MRKAHGELSFAFAQRTKVSIVSDHFREWNKSVDCLPILINVFLLSGLIRLIGEACLDAPDSEDSASALAGYISEKVSDNMIWYLQLDLHERLQ